MDCHGCNIICYWHCTDKYYLLLALSREKGCHIVSDKMVPRLQTAVPTATVQTEKTSTVPAHPFSERTVALQPTYCSTDEALVALAASVLGDLNGRTLHMSPRSCQNRPNSPSGPPWLVLVPWGSWLSRRISVAEDRSPCSPRSS